MSQTVEDHDDTTIADEEHIAHRAYLEDLIQVHREARAARKTAAEAIDIEGVDTDIAVSHYRHAIEQWILELRPILEQYSWGIEMLHSEHLGEVTIDPPAEILQTAYKQRRTIDGRRSRLDSRTMTIDGLWSLIEHGFPAMQRFVLVMRTGEKIDTVVRRDVPMQILTRCYMQLQDAMEELDLTLDRDDGPVEAELPYVEYEEFKERMEAENVKYSKA